MVENFRFGRLDSKTDIVNFIYTTKTGADADWNIRSVSMEDAGLHWSVTIRNYMREDLIMLTSLRTPPKIIPSVYEKNRIMLEDTTNYVVIELRSQENEFSDDGKVKIKRKTKIEIKCPGYLMETKSLFVEELGCYFTVRDRIAATQECIAKDSHFPKSENISVPESMVKPNPKRVFGEYESLVKNCVDRADKIRVRVGVRVDVSPSEIPEHIKSMKIAILDHHFSPYHANKMIYDISLSEDEFMIDNINLVNSEPLYSTFTRLRDSVGKSFFVDSEKTNSMQGTLCALAIFYDDIALSEYIFAHQAELAYDDISTRIVHHTGGYALNKIIEDLEKSLAKKDSDIEEINDMLKFERKSATEYKRMITTLETTIKNLKENNENSLSYDSVVASLENDRLRLQNERDRLKQEKLEMEEKMKTMRSATKANLVKHISEIIKSGWGALVVLVGIVTAIVNGVKKLKQI